MTAANPLFVARECQNMASKAGAESAAFQKGAMCLMGVMVVATVAGVLLQVYKEWKHTMPSPKYRELREDLDEDRRRSR